MYSQFHVVDQRELGNLSRCTNELFNLEDKIILYDLTNTYFEGRMKDSRMAKFGRSKEKRSDAKLIVLAVIVNTEGFSQRFEEGLRGIQKGIATDLVFEKKGESPIEEKAGIYFLRTSLNSKDERKKSVWHPGEILKKPKPDYQLVTDR